VSRGAMAASITPGGLGGGDDETGPEVLPGNNCGLPLVDMMVENYTPPISQDDHSGTSESPCSPAM